MKINNIQWDVEMKDVYKLLKDIDVEDAASVLGVSVDVYMKMGDNERYGRASLIFTQHPERLYEFLLLPTECDVPDTTENAAKLLEDAYGYKPKLNHSEA